MKSYLIDMNKRIGLTDYEKHLVQGLGKIAMRLMELEEKFQQVITPENGTEKPNIISDSVFSNIACQCINIVSTIIPIDDKVSDKVFHAVDTNRNPDEMVELIDAFLKAKSPFADIEQPLSSPPF